MQIKSGTIAEQLAKQYLINQNLRLVYNNYNCMWGELDLIMLDKQDTLIFVEVRERMNPNYGGAAESITKSKQQKIIKSAMHFLTRFKQYNKHNCRFDVVLFNASNTPSWIKNAFEVSA